MCGIAGIYSYTNKKPDTAYLEWCISTMKRRGPDDEGLWTNHSNYAAAFVRLSVRDITHNGHQPMLSSDGKHCISFNGEIYNAADIKNRLTAIGCKWLSDTDTECLLYAIIYWGIEKTLEIVDGMFAFSYFDVSKNRLILARDRMGIKPIYIGESSEGIVYSSQYDHIINHTFFNHQSISETAVGQYLHCGYVPSGCGFFEKTELMEPGSFIVVENNQSVRYRYYHFKPHKHQPVSQQLLSETIADAAASQLVSDVPVGCFLSGGVDSSITTWYAATSSKMPLQCFTAGYSDAKFDESFYAKQVAKKLALPHQVSMLSLADADKLVNEHTKAFSEPFADHSSLPLLQLASFAKEKVTVVLSGDGADELFWGYKRSINMLANSNLYGRFSRLRAGFTRAHKLKYGKEIAAPGFWNHDNFASLCYSRMGITGGLVFASDVLGKKPSMPSFAKELCLLAQTRSRNDLMQVARQMELYYHLQRILLKVDRSTMHVGLEARVPLLNNKMLELAAGLNHPCCIQKNEGKYILKKLLGTLMGNEFAFRDKKGFVIPINDWMRHSLHKDVEEKIMNMPYALSQYFNREKLWSYCSDFFAGSNDFGWPIWSVYMMINWYNTHTKKRTT
jgi:asparagine synthase (glutamine-hydrolysing)